MKRNSTLAAIAMAMVISGMQQSFAQSWLLNGNNLTANKKLGTLNGYPLQLYTNNFERIRIDTSGRVAIASTTPDSTFMVNGTSHFIKHVFVGTNAGPAQFLQFGTSAWMKFPRDQYIFRHSNSQEGLYGNYSLQRMEYRDPVSVPNFWVEWKSTGNAYLRGNLGIGTNVAAAKFDLNSPTSGQLARFNGGASLMYLGLYENGIYRGYLGSYSGNNEDVDFGTGTTNATGKVHLTIQGIPRFTLTNAGSVGIGTTAPSRKLNVDLGDIRISTNTSAARYFEFVRTTAASGYDMRFEHSTIDGGSLYVSSSRDNFATFGDIARFDTANNNDYVFRVFGDALATTWVNSDIMLKRDVNDFTSALDAINKLRPRTYFFKKSDFKNLNLPSEKQFGFIAQELETVLPELVKTSKEAVNVDANGQREIRDVKSVNYTELIPVLTKALQEQQQQIQELREQIIQLSRAANVPISRTSVNGAGLGQNNPNPLTQTTNIDYFVPEGSKNARLIITDVSGKVVKEIVLNKSGSGKVNVDASTFSSGVYGYSLFVDGKIMESKKMVVAR